VSQALTGAGVEGLTVAEAKGCGRQRGQTEIYRGAEYAVSFVPKVRLETVVDVVPAAVEAIQKAAATGSSSSTSEPPVRIRNSETAPQPFDERNRTQHGE
jgi:nitrogen regulatory protein PII